MEFSTGEGVYLMSVKHLVAGTHVPAPMGHNNPPANTWDEKVRAAGLSFDGSTAIRAVKSVEEKPFFWRTQGVAYNWLDYKPVPGRNKCFWPVGTEPKDGDNRIGWDYLNEVKDEVINHGDSSC